jgi:hypothetical protein
MSRKHPETPAAPLLGLPLGLQSFSERRQLSQLKLLNGLSELLQVLPVLVDVPVLLLLFRLYPAAERWS